MRERKEGSIVKHQAVVCMLDGEVWHGTMESPTTEVAGARGHEEKAGNGHKLYFEPHDGGEPRFFAMSSIKTIHMGLEAGSELLSGPRFFDSAPIPSSLWVRIALLDGEVVEGMIANSWTTLSGPLIQLQLPSRPQSHEHLLIPHSSISELQVITTR